MVYLARHSRLYNTLIAIDFEIWHVQALLLYANTHEIPNCLTALLLSALNKAFDLGNRYINEYANTTHVSAPTVKN